MAKQDDNIKRYSINGKGIFGRKSTIYVDFDSEYKIASVTTGGAEFRGMDASAFAIEMVKVCSQILVELSGDSVFAASEDGPVVDELRHYFAEVGDTDYNNLSDETIDVDYKFAAKITDIVESQIRDRLMSEHSTAALQTKFRNIPLLFYNGEFTERVPLDVVEDTVRFMFPQKDNDDAR